MSRDDPHPTDPRPAIRAALDLLLEPGQVVELRALGVGARRTTHAGYYDTWDACARDAARLSGQAEGVYWTLNPVDPRLLARCRNRVAEAARDPALTGDKNILSRRWLLVDCDAERPKGISTTDAEHAQPSVLDQ